MTAPAAIHTATVDQKQTLLDILLLSFVTDPITRYIWPRPRDYLSGYGPLATAMGGRGLALGAAHILGDGQAAALWLPPGVEPAGDEIAALVEETVAEDKQAVLAQVVEQMAEFHIHEPHWYLAMIGVDPVHQGRGLGSALLKHGLAACDAEGLPAYLESSNPKNVPLYERHGFEVMGVIQPADFPPLYPMLRPARG
jgi:ribosomal protein S18 acetylase RimI-like enzyme